MKLIEIDTPDTAANNLLYNLEQKMVKSGFKSFKWMVLTNKEHNYLKIDTYLAFMDELKYIREILIDLQFDFSFSSSFDFTNRKELALTITIENIDYATQEEPIKFNELKVPELIDISREELLSICEDAIIPWQNWEDRDSFSSQVLVSDIFGLLSTDATFTVTQDAETFWVSFKNVTQEQINEANTHFLSYDDRDEYLEENPDYEMFIGYGLDLSSYGINQIENGLEVSGYLPTRKRLEDTSGGDWY
jgi:hypothetical protein